jgi:hypothetical protein
MKPKTIVTTLLLTFVAASVVALIVKESRSRSQTSAPPVEVTPPLVHKVIAYYFHGNVRCMTCRAIEAQTQETIQGQFADALRDGFLEWRVVNIDTAGNEHFIKDYELTTRSVVLVELEDGKQTRWSNLPRVWELVHNPPAFSEYIATETRQYLEQL